MADATIYIDVKKEYRVHLEKGIEDKLANVEVLLRYKILSRGQSTVHSKVYIDVSSPMKVNVTNIEVTDNGTDVPNGFKSVDEFIKYCDGFYTLVLMGTINYNDAIKCYEFDGTIHMNFMDKIF